MSFILQKVLALEKLNSGLESAFRTCVDVVVSFQLC